MATVNISDDTYRRLVRRAAARNLSVQALVEPLLDRLGAAETEATDPNTIPYEEWRKRFEGMIADAQAWSERNLPPGFVVDDSRESIYEDRGE